MLRGLGRHMDAEVAVIMPGLLKVKRWVNHDDDVDDAVDDDVIMMMVMMEKLL